MRWWASSWFSSAGVRVRSRRLPLASTMRRAWAFPEFGPAGSELHYLGSARAGPKPMPARAGIAGRRDGPCTPGPPSPSCPEGRFPIARLVRAPPMLTGTGKGEERSHGQKRRSQDDERLALRPRGGQLCRSCGLCWIVGGLCWVAGGRWGRLPRCSGFCWKNHYYWAAGAGAGAGAR